jgi:peptidoglycan hydrolase CwlO-like protein
MLSIINILIVCFIFLISYQIILGNRIIEGIENQTSNVSIDIAERAYKSSLQNSAEMSTIEEKVAQLQKKTTGMPKRMDSLEKQMQELSQSVKQMGEDLPGSGEPLMEEEEEIYY